MCKRLGIGVALLLFASGLSTAQGQVFDFGSDGTFGAIDITVNTTLDIPADGIFNATTINVASGATLRFNRNALNTPVYLLATGDITIDGAIDVSGANAVSNMPVGGAGGPGGFDGGMPGFGVEVAPGAGFGPGGGLGGPMRSSVASAGRGAYGSLPNSIQRTADGSTYGSSLLVPLVGGSGGGGTEGQPGGGGGGGGGAILLASNTRIQMNSPGRVSSFGGQSTGNSDTSGSGGAIRLVAPVIAGNGQLDARGGSFQSSAGAGRIRVDTIDRTALQFGFIPTSVTAIGTLMFVFPDVVPRLDVVEAAGDIIPEGQPDPVLVLLPFGSTTSRTVTVQARDFIGMVPINVVLTPESGVPVVYPADIDMSTGNPAQVIVNVEIPVNTATRINAWTR